MPSLQGQIPIHMKGQMTCFHHKRRKLDFYCEKCQELVCLKCLSSIHKSHTVCKLCEIIPQKKKDIRNFTDMTEQNVLRNIRKHISSADTLLNDNRSTFKDLSQKLKRQTDKLKHELDKLTKQRLSLYRKMEGDNNKLIKKYKQDLEKYDKQLKQQIQECEAAVQLGSDIQIYDTFCEIHSVTSFPVKPRLGTGSFTSNKSPRRHLKAALGKVTTSGQGQTLPVQDHTVAGKGKTFTDQDQTVSTSDDKGQSSTQQQLSKSAKKRKKAATVYNLQPQTKLVEEWKSPCYVDSICPTTDGQVWTRYYNTLTLLDKKGKEIWKIKHRAEINDISLSPTTHTLWVCDTENKVMELVSGQHPSRFSTKEEPRCICATASNHVIVGMINNITKFTAYGKIVCTTRPPGTGKPLVCTQHRISECPVTHNVAAIDLNIKSHGGDGKQQVVVMDTDFKKLFVYKGDIRDKQTPQTRGGSFHPHDLVYDSVGNLIIGDFDNFRVLLLSGRGKFARVIYTDLLADYTQAIGVDRKDRLWTVTGTFIGHQKIKLLQYHSV